MEWPGIVAVLAGTVSGMFGSPTISVVGVVPSDFAVDIGECVDRQALLFGSVVRSDSRHPRGYTQDAGVLRVADSGTIDFVELGQGFISSASWSGDEVAYAVLRDGWEKGSNGSLFRSRDRGLHWSRVEGAPSDPRGVLISRDRLYAWSRSQVFRSFDGVSWSKVATVGPLGPGELQPVVSDDGKLWVPSVMREPDGSHSSVVVKISERLEDIVHFPGSTKIRRIVADEAGGLLVLAQEDDSSPVSLFRVLGDSSSGLQRVNVIKSFPASLPLYLFSSKGRILVVFSKWALLGPKDFSMVSQDEGQSWGRGGVLPERQIKTYCAVGHDGVWMVGSSGRIYAPSSSQGAAVSAFLLRPRLLRR